MKYILDALKMQTKEEAHTYLKEVLELPDYYGKNLDALYDCVSEMKIEEILIENLEKDNKYALLVEKIMHAAGVKVVTE